MMKSIKINEYVHYRYPKNDPREFGAGNGWSRLKP